MGQRENPIENKVRRDAFTKLGVDSVKMKLPSQSGWPDRMFLIPGGKPLMIEFKRPNKEPRKLQVEIMERLRKLGYVVEWHDNAEDALASIQRMLRSCGRRGTTGKAR
jgi:uncharacterized protein YyaL (SSP411 family)